MEYGKELLKSIEDSKEHTLGLMNDRNNRINEGKTDVDDCFVSMRMNNHSITEADLKISILKNGGLHEFEVLTDIKTGEIVSKNKGVSGYGVYWRIDPKYVSKFGKYVGVATRESTYKRKGLKLEYVDLPAWVYFRANGSGMYGAYSGSYVIFPSKINYWTGEKAEA